MANHAPYPHVFLSFRGETRDIFSYSLYEALKVQGFEVFMDKSDISVGDELNSTIQEGIKSSMSSIIVFSQNYAYSTWCLDELVLILERWKNSRYFIIPIFYYVEPRDIKYQLGNYGLALEKHMIRHGDKVEKWRQALSQVGNILGERMVGSQSIFIQNIVQLFGRKMAVMFPHCSLPQQSNPSSSRLPPIEDVVYYPANSGLGELGTLGAFVALGLTEKVLNSRYSFLNQHKTNRSKSVIEDDYEDKKSDKENSGSEDDDEDKKSDKEDDGRGRLIMTRDKNRGSDRFTPTNITQDEDDEDGGRGRLISSNMTRDKNRGSDRFRPTNITQDKDDEDWKDSKHICYAKSGDDDNNSDSERKKLRNRKRW